LWQSAKNEFPIHCAIARSSDWLKWKLGGHWVLEVRRIDDKKLIGYAAIKKGSGLLVDALARTQKDLETTLITAIEFLCHSDLANQAKPEEIKLMKTEALASVTEHQFYDWYVNTPHGECLIALAIDEENRIVGQEIFTPTKVYVGGIEKKALRLSAPILAKEFREKMGKAAHPSIQMFRVGLNAAVECGYSLI
jgi:hypothetical protein